MRGPADEDPTYLCLGLGRQLRGISRRTVMWSRSSRQEADLPHDAQPLTVAVAVRTQKQEWRRAKLIELCVVRISELRVNVDGIDLKVPGIRLVVMGHEAVAAVGDERVRLARAGQARDRHPDRHRAASRPLVHQAVQVGVLEVGEHQMADEGFGTGVSAQSAGMVDVTAGLAAEVPVSVVGKNQSDVAFRRLPHVPDRVLRDLLEIEVPLPDPRALQTGAYVHGSGTIHFP